MITPHGDILEIYLLGDSLQVWTKLKYKKPKRIDYDSEENIYIYENTDVEPLRDDAKLTDQEIIDVFEVIRQHLLSKRK